MKILATAVFAVSMLKKVLTKGQWAALCILIAGVCLIHFQPANASTKHTVTEQNPILGLLAVIASCMMSGFAGIYFEKIVKSSQQSLWERNFQLSFFSILFGVLTLFVFNYDAVINGDGFFQGYDWIVWIVVLLQSIGGLAVAAVVKYADNILKCFATSSAIIISCIASMYFFDFQLSWQFVTGASLVISSVYMYGKFAAKPKPALPTQV